MSTVDNAAARRPGIGLTDEAAARLPKWAQEYVRALEETRDRLASEAAARAAIPRSRDEIEQQIYAAAGFIRGSKWTTRWPGTTFEQGVHAALMWVTGQAAGRPVP